MASESAPLTGSQRTDWMEYVEDVWEHAILRAARGLDVAGDASGHGVYAPHVTPHLEIEILVGPFGYHGDPLEQVRQLESFVANLRREVTMSVAAGEFQERVIDARQSLDLMNANRKLRA